MNDENSMRTIPKNLVRVRNSRPRSRLCWYASGWTGGAALGGIDAFSVRSYLPKNVSADHVFDHVFGLSRSTGNDPLRLLGHSCIGC